MGGKRGYHIFLILIFRFDFVVLLVRLKKGAFKICDVSKHACDSQHFFLVSPP